MPSAFQLHQHGFRGGHACLSHLLNHFDKVTWFLGHGKPVHVVYLDFAKAFDKTDICITLRKLKSLGIQGETGRWLTDFLTNHKPTVLVDARKSVPQRVTSGVPQGSVLGPLVLLILIRDTDHNIAFSFISSFVDDTRVGRNIEDFKDIQLLQADLDAVLTYSSTLICLSFLNVNSGVPLFKIRQVTSPTLALKLKKNVIF